MPGALTHSPADILRELLIDLSQGTDPDAHGAWPVSAYGEPDSPDNCITCFDTPGRTEGKSQPDHEVWEMHGVQVRVRAAVQTTGWTKARALAVALDAVTKCNLTFGGHTYCVQEVSRTTDAAYIGNAPESKRHLWTINALIYVTES